MTRPGPEEPGAGPGPAAPDDPLVLHASCVAWGTRAVLIRGRSGSGKSALALDLLAWGCALVADDRVALRREGGTVVAGCPASIRGLIEARGVGLLRADPAEGAAVEVIADLDRAETERLPPWRADTLLGVPIPLLHKPATGGFAPALLQYLRAGRAEPGVPSGDAGDRPGPRWP